MPLKLTYHPNLYLGGNMNAKKLGKIIKKLENKPLFTSVFLITISNNSSDQLEIFSARQLVQSYYQKNPPHVIGIASDWAEAVEVVEKITGDCLKERGDCALKEYLRC